MITGIKREVLWDSESIEKWIKERIGIEIVIVEAWKTRRDKNKIVGKCGSRAVKETIMKNKRKLG